MRYDGIDATRRQCGMELDGVLEIIPAARKCAAHVLRLQAAQLNSIEHPMQIGSHALRRHGPAQHIDRIHDGDRRNAGVQVAALYGAHHFGARRMLRAFSIEQVDEDVRIEEYAHRGVSDP